MMLIRLILLYIVGFATGCNLNLVPETAPEPVPIEAPGHTRTMIAKLGARIKLIEPRVINDIAVVAVCYGLAEGEQVDDGFEHWCQFFPAKDMFQYSLVALSSKKKG
jgi:hypothetical protein